MAETDPAVLAKFGIAVAELGCAQAIMQRLSRNVGRRDVRQLREVSNIFERWLMALLNEAPETPPFKLFRLTGAESACYRKLAGELVEKGVCSRPNSEVVVKWVAATIAQRLEQSLAQRLEQSLAQVAVTYGRAVEVRRANELIFTRELPQNLIEMGGVAATAAVCLRYATMTPSVYSRAGQHWAIPRRHVLFLNREFGVAREAFASPLNSALIGVPGAQFCSLFPDTDAAFGSCGEFFGTPMRAPVKNWIVNPPFVDALLARAADRVIAALDEASAAGESLLVFFVGPAWHDAEFYRRLESCRHCAAFDPRIAIRFERDGAPVPSSALSAYFALAANSVYTPAQLEAAIQDVR